MRYVVKKGEDINSISNKFQSDPAIVASMNYLDGDLRVGDVLEIPSGASPEMEVADNVPGYKHGKSVKKSYRLRPGKGQDIQAELMKSAGLPESVYSYPAATGLTVNPSAEYSDEIMKELERIDKKRDAKRRQEIENMRKNYEQMLKHGMYDPYIQPYAMGGQVQPQSQSDQGFMVNEKKKQKPPIFGQSMPNSGMLRSGLGDIQDPDDKLTPQQYAQESASKKRLRKMSARSMGSQRPTRPTRTGEEDIGGKGIQMLDQLWSSLAPQSGISGFAEGGPVAQQAPDQNPAELEEAKQVYLDTLAQLRQDSVFETQGMSGSLPTQAGQNGMPPLPGGPAPMSQAIQSMGPGPNAAPPVAPQTKMPMPMNPPARFEKDNAIGIQAFDLNKQKEESVDAVKTGIMAARSIRQRGEMSGIGGLS